MEPRARTKQRGHAGNRDNKWSTTRAPFVSMISRLKRHARSGPLVQATLALAIFTGVTPIRLLNAEGVELTPVLPSVTRPTITSKGSSILGVQVTECEKSEIFIAGVGYRFADCINSSKCFGRRLASGTSSSCLGTLLSAVIHTTGLP